METGCSKVRGQSPDEIVEGLIHRSDARRQVAKRLSDSDDEGAKTNERPDAM